MGFTLIELVVTLTVLLVLAVVAAPAMGDFILRYRVRAAADDLASQVALARVEAMRLNRNVDVKVVASSTAWCAGGRQYTLPSGSTEGLTLGSNSSWPSCDCSSSTDVANCVVDNSKSLVTSTDYSGVEMTAGNGTDLKFDSKIGTLTDLTGATLVVRSKTKPDKYELNVVILPMGHAKVCIPSGYVNFGGYPSC